MSQSVQWDNQRSTLLRAHAQEWKDVMNQEVKDRYELALRHRLEKDQAHLEATVFELSSLAVLHTQQVIDLITANRERRRTLEIHHRNEITSLEEGINQERLKDGI